MLQTARARVSRADNQNYEINARVLFDSGSQRSYVKSNLKEQLALPTLRKEKLIIKTFGNENEELRECDIVQLCLRPLHDKLSIYLTAYSIQVSCSQICDQPVKFAAEKYEHLQGLQSTDNTVSESDLEITILIGSDQIWNYINGSTIRGQSGPIALESKLGYILSGPVENVPRRINDSSVNLEVTHILKAIATVEASDTLCAQTVDSKTKEFFDLETIGIKPNKTSVYDHFLDSIKFDGKKYVVKLPFRESAPLLPDKFQLSLI